MLTKRSRPLENRNPIHRIFIKMIVLFLIIILNISHKSQMVQSISIDNNSIYKNFVLEINHRVPKAECSTFLLNLEVSRLSQIIYLKKNPDRKLI